MNTTPSREELLSYVSAKADLIARDLKSVGYENPMQDHSYRMLIAIRDLISAPQGKERSCTCHPDEAPVPCQKKYALSECIAALASQPQGWRPISEAPRDGTILMLYGGTYKCCYLGSYFTASENGWWVSQCMPVKPTNFMHLPAPPASEGGGDEQQY